MNQLWICESTSYSCFEYTSLQKLTILIWWYVNQCYYQNMSSKKKKPSPQNLLRTLIEGQDLAQGLLEKSLGLQPEKQ